MAALDPEHAPLIVFVTAFDRYALPAFDSDAVDYLLKPFDPPRLRRAIARVRERAAARDGQETERVQRAAAAARAPDAPYPERLAVRARAGGDRRPARRPLDRGRGELRATARRQGIVAHPAHDARPRAAARPGRFTRVHRSHFVSLAAIRELRPLGDGDLEAVLDQGERLVVTRTYREELERRLGGIA